MKTPFDGDTTSATIVYSEEAVREVHGYLTDRKAYIDPRGDFKSSVATKTLDLTLFNMTG